MNIEKPVLKWVGGKTQIPETVLAEFPKEIINYHEPFLGGGSVLLGFLSQVRNGTFTVSGNIYASDLNANLISLYENIRTRPDDVISETQKLVEAFSSITGTAVNRKATESEASTSPESFYFWIRSKFNGLRGSARAEPSASAMLLFMNKTCFRGVYREGPNGFNVPFGNYKNPTIFDADHIHRVSDLIKDVIFTTGSYRDTLARVEPGDFVYLDPPYAPESSKSFVSYTANGFGIEEHKALFAMCHDMNDNLIDLVISNADVQLVRDSFPWHTQVIPCKRSINSKKPGSKTNEVLISNWR